MLGSIGLLGLLAFVLCGKSEPVPAPYSDTQVEVSDKQKDVVVSNDIANAGDSQFNPALGNTVPDTTPYFQRYNFAPAGSVQPSFKPSKCSKLKFGLEPSVFYDSNNTISAVG